MNHISEQLEVQHRQTGHLSRILSVQFVGAISVNYTYATGSVTSVASACYTSCHRFFTMKLIDKTIYNNNIYISVIYICYSKCTCSNSLARDFYFPRATFFQSVTLPVARVFLLMQNIAIHRLINKCNHRVATTTVARFCVGCFGCDIVSHIPSVQFCENFQKNSIFGSSRARKFWF